MADCIEREVLEETGLVIKKFQVIGFASDPATEVVIYPNGDQTHSFSLIAYGTEWDGSLIISNEESLALAFFHPGSLPDMHSAHLRTVETFLEFKTTGRFQLY